MASHKRLPQRRYVHIRHPRRCWMSLPYTPRDASKLTRRLLCAHGRFELGKYGIPVATSVAGIQGRHGAAAPISHRQPDLGVVRHVKLRRHDTDDLERAATKRIDVDRLTYYLWISTELFPPVPIADDNVALALDPVVLVAKRTPQKRPRPQHPKEA